jgi:hypothetical protein
MKKTTQTTSDTKIYEWKKHPSTFEEPEDDKTYLVTWRRANNIYNYPQLAYWIQEEHAFFSLNSFNNHPLHVDLYIEIPELP